MFKTVGKQSIKVTLRKRYQSPTGHPNQIHKVNERQPLLPVSQSLQIFHKFC